MQFSKRSNCLRVSRITGPRHNLLGIEFGAVAGGAVPCVTLGAVSDAQRALNADEVRRCVLDGVREANAEHGTSYEVSRIEYVADDSPPAAIYRELAKAIVRRLVERGDFSSPSGAV